MNQVLIYTEETTERLSYTLNLLLTEMHGLNYELTHDAEYFAAARVPKFSYAKEPVSDEIFFESARLLFEKNVYHQPIMFCELNELKGFYATSERSAVPFDIFASAFFMVTRYEEYLPSKKDKYDRYRGSQSMICKSGFLEQPMVNMYALFIKKTLRVKYPELTFRKNTYSYLPTFDIDMAYAFKHKSLKRSVGGFFRDFLFSDLKDLRWRIEAMLGRRKDPFDTFDYIFSVLNKHQLPSIFFFLLGDESRFDKSIDFKETAYRKLIKDISSKTETGIHLSFRSHVGSNIESEEMARLEEITGKKTIRNRYHYLRFHVSNSYQRLIDKEIFEDHSMGYAARPGFRAGICTPYFHFSLKDNKVTPLKIFPIAFMDTTFVHYRRLSIEDSLEVIRTLIANVKAVDGMLVGLWHNSSLSDRKEWKGWTSVFETVSQEAHPNYIEHE